RSDVANPRSEHATLFRLRLLFMDFDRCKRICCSAK
ncbi:hypothetical protein CCACVL1_28148, partial [Corchorus capsularis]